MDRVTISNFLFQKTMAITLAVLLSVPLCHAQQQTQQQTPPANAPPAQTQTQNSSAPPPKPSPNTTEPGSPDIQAPAPSSQTTTSTPQTTPQEQQPVGTAAAPYEKPIGSAVSRPAGAAIAPGKQRRRRTFLIKVGLVVGAAVAVGTVVALSKGSPARPNQ